VSGRREQHAEERRRLIGFIRTVSSFMNKQAPASGLLTFKDVPLDDAPIIGLRMAAGDMVEWCQDLAGEPLARLDAMLAAAGLPTLTAMRNSEYRDSLSILARNKVSNEREWHVLSRFVVDTADGLLSAAERRQAERLVGEYRRRA
jgi:hypothetical protein